MFKIAFLFFFYLALLTLSCSSNNDSEKNESYKSADEQIVADIEQDLQEEQNSEVVKIEKRSVIFFIISKKEALNISKEIGESYRWEADALFTSFINQSITFIPILKKHNINSALSNAKQFEIKLKNGKLVTFDRIKEDQILGEILTDGEKKPLICFGMYKNTELAELIQDFFGIKNIGYFPPDSLDVSLDDSTSIDSAITSKPIN